MQMTSFYQPQWYLKLGFYYLCPGPSETTKLPGSNPAVPLSCAHLSAKSQYEVIEYV